MWFSCCAQLCVALGCEIHYLKAIYLESRGFGQMVGMAIVLLGIPMALLWPFFIFLGTSWLFDWFIGCPRHTSGSYAANSYKNRRSIFCFQRISYSCTELFPLLLWYSYTSTCSSNECSISLYLSGLSWHSSTSVKTYMHPQIDEITVLWYLSM